MTVLEQLLSGGLFIAVSGSYVYIHKVAGEMRNKQRETETCVKKAMRTTQEALTALTLAVSVRLAAIERQLEIQLPTKAEQPLEGE